MPIEILTTADQEKWWSYFRQLPEISQHIHFTPEYHSLLEENGDGQGRLFVNKQNEKLFFYPFMLASIDQVGEQKIEFDYHDVRSVFGYTGPLILAEDEKFVQDSQTELEQYFAEKNVISEMIRYNPILKNDDYSAKALENIAVKEYVYVDFPNKVADLTNLYSSRLNTYLNKAARSDFEVQVTTDRDQVYEFFDLYCQHMTQMDVDNYYLFSAPYFDRLYRLMQDYGYLIYGGLGGEMAAGLIFLEYKDTSYYHHGARNTAVDNSGLVNKYLFHQAFAKQIQTGFSKCLLGGGATSAADDSLLQFKKYYANKSANFVIGKRVVDQTKYQKIINIWEQECSHLKDRYGDFVDKYRFC